VDAEKKKVEDAQVVFNALNQQRKGSILKLEERVSSLMDGSINIDNLEKPQLVNVLREMAQSMNSALLALSSHDKLIDTLLNELVRVFSMAESGADGSMQAAFAIEVIGNLLLNKEVVSKEEIETEQKKTQDRIEKAREEHQKMMAQKQAEMEKKVSLS
jgi:hypothetical protein